MTDAIKTTTKRASEPEIYNVKIPKLAGVLAFYRISSDVPWSSISPIQTLGTTAPVHCPWPLFQNKDAVISTVRDGWYSKHNVEVLMFEVRE